MCSDRIAILHYAAPPIVGGVEKTIFHQAQRLSENGYLINVIAGRGEDFYPAIKYHCVPEIDSRHSKVLEIGDELARGVISSKFESLQSYLVDRLRALLSESRVCIAHNVITLQKNLPLTAALHKLCIDGSIKLIAWCHDFAWQDQLYIPDLHPGYPWDLLRTPWPNTQYVVVSNNRRDRLAELLGISKILIKVINPGVDIFKLLDLHPTTRLIINEFDLLGKSPIMLLPARITRRKNIEFAIKITAALKKIKSQAVLIITGPPGPHNPKNISYLEYLISLRDNLDLSKRVHFLYEYQKSEKPFVVPDEILADFYRFSDMLLFPSRREGFGIPILEAGLVRIPIFAANIPPIRETASGLAHLFDPDGSPEMVARLIVDTLEQDRAYQFHRRVIEKYSWEKIIDTKLIPLIKDHID